MLVYLRNGARYGRSCCRIQLRNLTQAIEWWHFRWPWVTQPPVSRSPYSSKANISQMAHAIMAGNMTSRRFLSDSWYKARMQWAGLIEYVCIVYFLSIDILCIRCLQIISIVFYMQDGNCMWIMGFSWFWSFSERLSYTLVFVGDITISYSLWKRIRDCYFVHCMQLLTILYGYLWITDWF